MRPVIHFFLYFLPDFVVRRGIDIARDKESAKLSGHSQEHQPVLCPGIPVNQAPGRGGMTLNSAICSAELFGKTPPKYLTSRRTRQE
jgi:hypothetical protein